MPPMTLKEAQDLGHGTRSQAFADWRNALDRALVKLCGLTADEAIGDWRYADYFADGVSPSRAAKDLWREARYEY